MILELGGLGRSALFCLIDEHDGNVIDDRIDQTTRGTSKTVLLFRQLDGVFAGRADEDVEKLL